MYRKYSFQKLTQFSQEINVLDGAASKIAGFLWRYTCASSTQLKYPISANKAYVHLGNYTLQEVILSKTNSIITGKEYGSYYYLLNRWFSFEKYMCFFTLATRPVWKKIILSPP
jgi:hypothetical protein